jgi:aromatic ring hydroxylase
MVTLAELEEWERLYEFVMERTMTVALSNIDPAKVKAYLSQEDVKHDLLALGKIFEVLGHHAQAFMGRTDFVNLVKAYVTQFEGSPRALPGLDIVDGADTITPF